MIHPDLSSARRGSRLVRLARLLLPAVLACVAGPRLLAVEAKVDATKTFAPISPYVYGQFVEHAGSLVYSSLWSELLDDRKFFYAVTPPIPEKPDAEPARPWRRLHLRPGRWNPLGPADSVVMDTQHPYTGEHSPVIHLAGAEPRGFFQDGVKISGGAYNGRICLAGDPAAEVTVSLIFGEGAAAVRHSVSLGHPRADYAKYPFSFDVKESGKARFEISATGQGSLKVGAVSLMPAHTLSGFRPEPITALKSLRSGVYRLPGGNFVSAHEWRNAIGDPDRRPPEMDPVWKDVQSNDIGTDELLTLCRLLEVDPYITVNAGTGDAWSAAQYVEYTNGSVDTPMGNQRAANGHPAPYNVKFWGIGNEMWGSYQYGYMPEDQYLFKHTQFAKAMRRVDPSIVLIASGAMPDTMTGSKEALKLGKDLVPAYLSPGDWTGQLLLHCFNDFDLISEHFYNFGNTHFDLAKGDQVTNDPKEPITDWMRRGANHVRIKVEEYEAYKKLIPELNAHPRAINLDEWAYMGGNHPNYPAYGWIFQEMFRHSDLYQMAAQTFATSLLTMQGSPVKLNANGLVFKLYRDHFGTLPVAVTGDSPQPKPTDPFGGEQPAINAGSDTFPLDVVSAWTADHRTLTVAVLNPTDVEQPLKLAIAGASLKGSGTLARLASPKGDGKDPVISETSLTEVPSALQLPPFSISIYEFPAR